MKIRTLKIVPLVAAAFAVAMLANADSFAVPGNISVRDVSDGRYLSLNEVKGNYRLYNSRAEENPESAEELRRFLRKKFEIEALPPDDMSYDLLSNTLQVITDFPLKVIRRRGTDFGTTNLLIFAPLERPLGRKMLAHREQVYLKVMFHLNGHGAMVIDDLRVFFGKDEVYRE